MEIKQIKFDELDSTQTWLKENIISHLEDNLLVSTKSQTKGTGRHGNTWSQYGTSLAFSFLAKPCEPLTLTSLEVGVQISNFLKSYDQEVLLKWPNDLLVKNSEGYKKVGGILANFHSKELLIIGAGLNLEIKNKLDSSDFKFPPGQLSIDLSMTKDFYHSLPKEFYRYLLENRLNSSEVVNTWNQLCAHKNTLVEIIDGNHSSKGEFIGIGENGEALLKGPDGIKKFVSGSLIF